MANQTELLNVSDEMKLDDERQSFEGHVLIVIISHQEHRS